MQEILNLDSSKACQKLDLSTKIIKAQTRIFSQKLYTRSLMKALEVGNFPCIMTLSNVTPVHKKAMDQRKIIIDLSACCPTY